MNVGNRIVQAVFVLMSATAGFVLSEEPIGASPPEPKLTTPVGEYSLIRVQIRDGTLVVGVRDQKPVTAHAFVGGTTYEVDAKSITFDGKALKGAIKGGGKDLNTTLDATVDGGKLVGATPGEIRTAEQLSKENALAAGPGWPWWYGPNGDFSGQDGGHVLVDSFADARLMWVSEAVLRHGNTGRPTGYGGFSACVEGDGKVIFNQYRACGPTEANNNTDAPKETIEGRTYVPIEADDEVWCFDAASGRTLWSVSFPGASVNQPQKDKHVLYNMSGCYYGGTVFMFGFTFRIYALDAKTGKLLWQGNLGKAHEQAEKDKTGMIASKSLNNMVGRGGYNVFLAVADGTLFANNMSGGVNGYDSKTGRLLWTAPGSYPHRWVHQDPSTDSGHAKEYILVRNGWSLECLDPKTGKAVWKTAGVGGGAANSLLVSGDCMIANAGDGKNGYTTQYWKLSATGATRVCDDKQYAGIAGYLAGGHKGKFLAKWDWQDGKRCYDEKIQNPWTLTDGATGKALAMAPLGGGGGWNTLSFFLEGRPFCCMDAGHGGLSPSPLGVDLKPMARWTTPATGGYDVAITHPYVDGRWFVRGNYRIYCFDLRKEK
jgi:outer membrane protein assembly factor BamB